MKGPQMLGKKLTGKQKIESSEAAFPWKEMSCTRFVKNSIIYK